MSKNDITGDKLISKPSSATYADGWEMIYGKKKGENIVKEDTSDSRCSSQAGKSDTTSCPCGEVCSREET